MDKPHVIVIEVRKTLKVRTVHVKGREIRVVVVGSEIVVRKVLL